MCEVGQYSQIRFKKNQALGIEKPVAIRLIKNNIQSESRQITSSSGILFNFSLRVFSALFLSINVLKVGLVSYNFKRSGQNCNKRTRNNQKI